MNFLKIEDDYLVIKDEKNDILEIALQKISRINTSVLAKYKLTKRIIYFTFILGVLFTLLNIKENIIEKKVPQTEIYKITFERGFNKYVIQPDGDGTTIYDVYLGKDGYYYSKNIPLFIITELLPIALFATAFGLALLSKPIDHNFRENRHTISIYFNGVEEKVFYVGSFEKTKEVYEEIKNRSEKIKLK